MSPLLFLVLAQVLFSVCTAKPPNIIILLADDIGWGDLAVYGHPTMTTPNLDRLAEEGLLFKQFYSTSPVCSPSRAALLTGRYQTRSGVNGLFFPESTGGLPLNETTLAEGLKSAGYYSAIVGKWHLGVGKNFEYLPTNQGFDYYFGIPYSHDMCPCTKCFYPDIDCSNSCLSADVACPIFSNTEIVQQPADFLNLTNAYISNAKDVIRKSAAQSTPFFLYMAFQHTHDPQFAGKKFTGTSIRGDYGDAMNELDWGVGEILEAMRTARVERNTFIFFTSDNGPSLVRELNGGSAGLLRCGKGTTWEGGQRVPGIAWWPERIKPGRTLQVASTLDLFPTVMRIANAKLPDVTLDGIDITPTLFGDQNPTNNQVFMHYPSGPSVDKGVFAVRWNQYKAHYYADGGLCGENYPDEVCRSSYGSHSYDPPLLYDLNHDPSELYHLNTSQPQYASILAHMTKMKSDFDSSMVWGANQIEGFDYAIQPCAKPGCSPFPQCCATDAIHNVHPQNMSWAII